jgi:hypothetical protein
MKLVEHGPASAPRPSVALSGDILSIEDITIDLLAESSDAARHVPICVSADGVFCRDHGGQWGAWAALAILPPLIPGAPGETEDDPPTDPSVDHDALIVHTWPIPATSEGDLLP